MEIKESDLTFTFNKNVDAIKFDDTKFYRTEFNHQPESKGVDIIVNSSECCQFIEIKNCTNHEAENWWRLFPDNSKAKSAPQNASGVARESLDVEVAKKVASTIICLYGAQTKSQMQESAMELNTWWKSISDCRIATLKKQLIIILFLEGRFDNTFSTTRSKRLIMYHLEQSIKKKLSWLNCRVSVVDSSTYQHRYFTVK